MTKLERLSRKQMLWIELAVVTCLFLAPRFFPRSPIVPGTTGQWAGYIWNDLHTIILTSGFAAAVLFIIWSSGDKRSQFGLRVENKWQVLSVTMALLAIHAVYLSLTQLRLGRWSTDFHTLYAQSSRHGAEIALGVLAILIQSATTELVLRGYYLTRLKELIGSAWMATICMTVLMGLTSLIVLSSWDWNLKAFAVVTGCLQVIAHSVAFYLSRSLLPGFVASSFASLYTLLVIGYPFF